MILHSNHKKIHYTLPYTLPSKVIDWDNQFIQWFSNSFGLWCFDCNCADFAFYISHLWYFCRYWIRKGLSLSRASQLMEALCQYKYYKYKITWMQKTNTNTNKYIEKCKRRSLSRGSQLMEARLCSGLTAQSARSRWRRRSCCGLRWTSRRRRWTTKRRRTSTASTKGLLGRTELSSCFVPRLWKETIRAQ